MIGNMVHIFVRSTQFRPEGGEKEGLVRLSEPLPENNISHSGKIACILRFDRHNIGIVKEKTDLFV